MHFGRAVYSTSVRFALQVCKPHKCWQHISPGFISQQQQPARFRPQLRDFTCSAAVPVNMEVSNTAELNSEASHYSVHRSVP